MKNDVDKEHLHQFFLDFRVRNANITDSLFMLGRLQPTISSKCSIIHDKGTY